jgi:hypothetical protein
MLTKGKQPDNFVSCGVRRTLALPADIQNLTHSLLAMWNVVSPYIPCESRKANRKASCGYVGKGL